MFHSQRNKGEWILSGKWKDSSLFCVLNFEKKGLTKSMKFHGRLRLLLLLLAAVGLGVLSYCGIGAEERGQGQAIAENLLEMSTLCVPIISIFIGEGGSGGALALAVADRVWMLENSVYSVISPEGCASILWKDSARAAEACDVMKITAEDLLEYGLIDGVIQENEQIMKTIDGMLLEELKKMKKMKGSAIAKNRYEKFRKIDGAYLGEGQQLKR